MAGAALAVSTARNSGPILQVLRWELRSASRLLEIGSGNGQHATTFASELQHLTWQTSDLETNHASINSWLSQADAPNVFPPFVVDVLEAKLPAAEYDSVFSANSAHIMGERAVAAMFALVAHVLQAGGVFCLYGPFRQNGEFNAASNAAFHASLRARDAAMGIRHLEDLDAFAASRGLQRERLYAMPANNYLVVWQKHRGSQNGDN